MSYAFKLAAVGMGIVVAFVLGIVIFSEIWYQIGLVAALVVICAPLLFFAWRSDRKTRREREGLEDI
jgi:membrane protein implicated in regulation of membrane protease activity